MSVFLEEKQLSLATTPYNAPVTEKPFHYTYLKDFRVEQCQLFLQHKCTQHRPFTCFNWHFMNQRRRRPRKKKDGTFNYSPDVYCAVYDENTGLCPNGDDCQYLHRTAGDTERRYHLRYYKTSTCVYETDSRGFCVKNGPHCAFAHGPHDLRPPVYDVRELQGLTDDDDKGSLVGSLERDKGVLLEDPRWQDHSFVLTYYKTEPCKRPPRLCRQGYACPYFHNAKDRRRGPKGFNYRSTPCPSVKLNDEWSDPAHCDRGDSCPYCHTRTEQQFHPEIYKSTKCNDIQQTGYCPRGPFCAFAHNDGELTESRTLTSEPMISTNSPGMSSGGSVETDPLLSTSPVTTSSYYGSKPSQPQPIATHKLFYQEPMSSGSPFQRAPGAEFNKSHSLEDHEEGQSYLMRQFEDIDNDCSLDEAERQRRKNNLMKLVKMPAVNTAVTSFRPSSLPSCVTGTLEAMVGPNLDDLTLDDIDSSGLEAITPEEPLPGSADIVGQSPIAQGFMQSIMSHSSSSSLPYSTPLGPLSPFTITTNQSDTTGLLSFSEITGIEPLTTPSCVGAVTMPHVMSKPTGMQQSPRTRGSQIMENELFNLREELTQARAKLASWEDHWRQAKQVCDAWKHEAEDANNRAALACQERDQMRRDQEQAGTISNHLHAIAEVSKLDKLPLSTLEKLHVQIKSDLDKLDSVISHRHSTKCIKCQEFQRCVVTLPCKHCVLCESCAESLDEGSPCPHCNVVITSRSTVFLPL